MGTNLIITITRRGDTEQFTDFFRKYGCTAILSVVANGTANQKLLAVFGLESTEKSISFTFADDKLTTRIMRKLSSEMKIDMPDRGIAVAIPLSSMSGLTASALVPQQTEASNIALNKGQSVANKEEKALETKYELIVTICSGGHTDIVMDAARSAGAAGGTVIHAKGTGAAGAKKFFGLSIADEKEMVFIVSSVKNKKDIMRAIMHNAGAGTQANSLVFSLPVAETAGFKLIDDSDEETVENT